MGHTEVGIMGGPPRLWTSEQRLAGYREAIAAAGLNADEVPALCGDYTEDSGYQIAREILGNGERSSVTALICANDLMAIGAMKYCRDAHINVPRDVSITGFDDIPAASLVAARSPLQVTAECFFTPR